VKEKQVYVLQVSGNHYDALILRKSKRSASCQKLDSQEKDKTTCNKVSENTNQPMCEEIIEELSDDKIIEDDDTLYCVCQRRYNYDEHECMIKCDKCDEWYHCDCIAQFSCDKCRESEEDKMEQYKNTIKQMKEQRTRDKEEIENLLKKDRDVQKYKEKLKLAEKDNAKAKTELKKFNERA